MRLREVDLDLIVVLDALLARRNVTRAGRDVGLGQSATSHALARLRAHFGDELLAPARRALVLTPRARTLVEPAGAAVKALAAVFGERLGAVDVNLIVPLRALLHEASVTRAARSLGRTQSATSHALARLRACLGDPLLVRAGRGAELTPRASALIPVVERAIDCLHRVLAVQPFEPATSARTFRLVGTDNLELYLVPRLAALIEREAPQVTLRFHHLDASWANALHRGDADLKLGRRYPVGSGLRSATLCRERLVCVVRGGHPAARRPITLEALAELDHVVIAPTLALTDSLSTLVDDQLRRRGLERRVAMTVSHFLVAPFVVASSDLVLTCSERLARTFAPQLGLRVLAFPVALPGYDLAQVWAARCDDDPGHRWLRDLVKRALASTASMPPIDTRHAARLRA